MAKENGESDEISFLRTEDYICLNCSVTTQNGINRRMALAAEAFGNKMCFLEDITLENVTPDFPACMFVLEQSLSVKALQEVVSGAHQLTQSGHRTLLYGHAVLLRHLQSNMYLTCLSTSTSNDKLAFDVGLQHQAQGESCWWTIHPASKQRSIGEKVRIGDDIILVSVASERYLHIYLVDNAIHRVNASFQQTLWTLLPISCGSVRLKNTGFIYGGEVLRLYHGNIDQCFTLPQPGVSEFPYSVFFETGAVCSHARSLWRLEFLRTKWYGGFMTWNTYIRLRHITSGRYLGVVNGEVCVMHRDKANADAITFILIQTKDDKKTVPEILADETMGGPTIKYGDTLAYIMHAKSNFWLSYQTYETKKRGVGKVEEKKAALSEEGHMDDCFTIVRAQEEESRSALVIRKCMSLFSKFIRAMDPQESGNQMMNRWKRISLDKVLKCLEDLIEFFAQPKDDCSHEDRQNKLKILRNRQDLFHEEGMISLVLETIDKYSETKNQKTNIELFDGCKQQTIDDIYDQLYALLATMIKGNRNNCSQFAQGNRLDLLINRLTSQQASKGVLEVLQCVLVGSPEALNMIKERHIQGIISLLDRNGKDPKVLSVLCSLCANNGIAVRTNQNLICENLLPRRDLLLQTRVIDQIACLRPNLQVGVEQGESMYKKWYFEVEIDFIESLKGSQPHCRIGWASTDFHPTPDGADGFSSIGVGDDVYSFGFDGANLWFGGRSQPINTEQFTGFKKGDVIGCLLDLSIPEIWFSLNGVPMKGFFREFNLYGMFYPVVSVSAKISCRFLFGDEHGRFKSGPPEGCAPIYQAMLQKQRIKLEPCFSFGDYSKSIFHGPIQPLEQTAFTPNPVDTSQTVVPEIIDSVRDRLAENLHEIWAMYKIEQGWKFSEFRNDAKKLHNCLCQFEMLPRDEKLYDTNLAMETLKTMFALGFQVIVDLKQDQKRLKLLKLNNSYLQANGYKPQPLDLTHIALNPKLEELVELLAENTHNVWAKERIRNGWTYGVCENPTQKRHPYLLPYDKVDIVIKKANRETSLDTVKTLLAYGYMIEPPVQDAEEGSKKHNSGEAESGIRKFQSRSYRAENTYAINSGKWYYEVEVLTAGSIRIGWTLASCSPVCDISSDAVSYSFDVSASTKWHNNVSDHFGKACVVGDIVGVMIDLVDKTISFSLNGEFLLDSVGSEAAFDFIPVESYVPAFSLFSGQKIRVNFGQDVNSLRYFTNCGLQEGYEPFAVNMTKLITFWYSNEIPTFDNLDESHESLEIIPSTCQDSSPCFKLVSKLFGTGKTKMEYMRLSLPVAFHDEYTSKSVLKEKRANALAIYKSQLEEEAEMNQQMYSYDQSDMGYGQQMEIENVMNQNAKSGGIFSKISPKQNRSKSPFKLLTKLSRDQSPNQKGLKQPEVKTKFSRSSEYGTNQIQYSSNNNQVDFFSNQQATFDANKEEGFSPEAAETSFPASENDDMEMQAIMEFVEEYYYGVRIFPGQDIGKVFVGWTTSRFHLVPEKSFNKFGNEAVTKCTLINTTSDGSIISSLNRKDCYVVSAAELNLNNVEQDSKKSSDGLLIGCVVDISTGVISFMINGKEMPQKFQVEPGTKLYPAVFVEPTTKEVLQLELSRVRGYLPLSAALFPSLGKHVQSKCPSRLKLQYLRSTKWSRVLNQNLKAHTLKMNNILGWSLLAEENVNIMALNIPEEDRWISILELNENSTLLEFYSNMISLYEAVCAQSNNYVAHSVSKQIDEKQLMYCIENHYLNGLLRKGFYELLIKVHLEAFVAARTMTKHEYVIPLTQGLKNNVLENHEALMLKGQFPSRDEFVSVRPSIIKDEEIKEESHRLLLIPPKFNLENLKYFVINSFTESVKTCAAHIRDPIGGTKSFLFVPIIKLLNKLLMIDIFSEQDLNLFMTLFNPHRFTTENFQIEEGLLDLTLEDDIKYEICLVLHSLCDYLLRFRIEAIANFSTSFIDEVQRDQKKRYTELKESKLPSAVMAKKTKEFRCGPKDQMNYIVRFKEEESSMLDLNEDIKTNLTAFHQQLNKITQIKQRAVEEKAPEPEEKSMVAKIFTTLFFPEYSNGKSIDSAEGHVEEITEKLNELQEAPPAEAFMNVFSDFIKETIIKWAKGSFITDNVLVRSMFDLIFRQYNALGEISECLNKTYVIGEASIGDVTNLLRGLSTVRSLLCVQMGPSEEEIMKGYLNEIMDNKVFFQHPDLMRALCVHETVMQVMINWLNRRQQQHESNPEVVASQDNAVNAMPAEEKEAPKEENAELVVVCCKFLSYFSRTSRHNQRAMFEHLSYLLDNSSMLLSRPSLRGSCPLDVACSSLMDNNDLSLALRESHLEKISVYLSRCGLQSNQDLLSKGYPDIGWDPVEGERFLDFLKFCVWVNGDSVEENANLIVRLLIRRPECLGPALRGEGGGLLKATIDGLKISLQIAATQNIQNPIVMSALLDADSEIIDFMNENKFDFTRIPSEEDEDYIDLGAAMVSFYISLVELLGRSAPSEETIKMGKSDSIRARSILRSLVSMEDLERVLSIRFILPIPAQPDLNSHLPGLQPSHKMSIVLFLERVYGIPDQATFLRILETAFLPDIRCATILDASTCAEGDMALALNRYLCCSVLPLLTSYSHYFDASENKTSLMETVLNTVYRLSKCKSLTTGQLNVVCEFLIAFTNQMKPPMMRNLLRKLVVDLPTLDECTIVPLKMLTLWYEKCGKYYSSSPIGIQASEEEKKLTMTLFTRIFDALARRTYNPELFSKALPCLSAIGCALSPDYSYVISSQEVSYQAEPSQKSKRFEPQPIQTVNITLTGDFETLSKQYSEHVHDYWCFNKFEEGWSYGEVFNDAQKCHALLKPYQNLSRKEQMKYEDLTREILKSVKALGWTLEKGDMNASTKNAPRLIQSKLKESVNTNGFYPRPFDLTNTTLTRELEELALSLAINCHNIRAKKKQTELENIGAELHHLLVPYDLLTDREKVNDKHFTNELLKFLQISGYRMQPPPENTNNNRHSYNKANTIEGEKVNEIKFAFNLLEKLLEYVEKAAMNMYSLKESAKFTRKATFKTSGQDVKFFTKVVLPLIEKYFQSQRAYFIVKTNVNKPGAGVATAKEKEMACSLFCKLALLMRRKLSCFGSDTHITVRCLQVLIRAVDISSVMKNSQEIIRSSILPLFTYAADDLNMIIDDLKNYRLSNIKGTSQKTLSNLDYIHMVLLPLLSAMFEHIGANKYGGDLMVGEIQLLSYKILNALWILGTLGTKIIDREWIINELNRHRPLIGDCLRFFAASFPIGFLEPSFNSNNKYSIMYGATADNLSGDALEGLENINKVSKNLPSLQDLVTEIATNCESGVKYEDAPHIVEILMPTICSYFNYWWSYGPSAKQINDNLLAKKNSQLEKSSSVDGEKPPAQAAPAQPSTSSKPSASAVANVTTPTEKFDGAQVTNVTSEMMNQILGYILLLINNSVEEPTAAWMNRIATFSGSIISNSTPDLLEKFFLPVSSKISLKADEIYNKELSIRVATRNADATERESAEGELQKDYEVLIRDIYAFYPLLIKYVDLHKSFWIKNPDEHSEKLYNNVAEVFNLWLKSKIFQKEERTFVSQNEIDNMLLIMPSSSNNMISSEMSGQPPADAAAGKGKKRRGKGGVKKFTSLIVASLRRLIQIGINFFGGSEQELIQMAKHKFIQITYASNSKSSDFLLNKDQEDIVEDFVRRYLKSSAESSDSQAANETIDKETYQKTKWQRMLYKKIGSKRNLVTTMVNLSSDDLSLRIMDIAKVLYGLHMVEHPPIKSTGILRKLVSGQRKKAIMGCFRMAPLYSIANHRAINIFLKSYKTSWLDNEAENDTDIACLIPDLCPQEEHSSAPAEGNGEEKKEGEEGAVVVASTETPEPLRQLITTFNYAATTDSGTGNNLSGDILYMSFATIMSRSCVIEEEEEGGGEEGGEEGGNSFEEQEIKKQKLLFEQNRLAGRGAAEMVLLYISASKGEKTEMLEKTLRLGISLLHGGNTGCQHRMLAHLQEKKDSGFFTSLAALMSSCTVLDLDTFERCIKAEQFGGKGDGDGSGMAGKKNLHDSDFTCSIFRFLQLLCEGHNLDFQNYLRVQPGNNTLVNTIICTVDYLLRLQESMMDFYWHYSGRATVDEAGRENFSKAITIASQVFNTLTEFMQGPCVGNQLTLAQSRLWDAIGGFLMIFANMQEKLSKDPNQIDFLRELMGLQKDMIIMLLSMLEGNILNGPIGKQMVDTLIENQQNVDMILQFFDIFLKMKDLTSSESFLEFDTNGDGIISPKEFRKAMEAQKAYSSAEIDYVLMTVDQNQDGKIDFNEISERFHNPAKDIGFNLAVLLTNLSEHMSHDARLDRLIKKASSFIGFFEPYLGRIEITGSSGRIERVYFEIKEDNLEQWEKPQIKDSKRQFLFDVVNEGDAKEKLEHFVNFCEDTIFEMQHAASISAEEAAAPARQENTSVFRRAVDASKEALFFVLEHLSPNKFKAALADLKQLSNYEIAKLFLKTNVDVTLFVIKMIITVTVLLFRCLYLMTLGQTKEKEKEKSALAQLIQSETLSSSKMNLAITDSHEESNSSEIPAVASGDGLEIGATTHLEPVVSFEEGAPAEAVAATEGEVKHEEGAAEAGAEGGEAGAAPAPASSFNLKNLLSTLARNFYKLKYLALVLAFLINFLMLFYKARALGGDESMSTDVLAEEGGEEEELIEIIMMDPDEYYIEYFIKVLAFTHSIVAFAMLVAYYVLKVPLLIFKREKEVSRKLEFEGLWLTEQPGEDDLRSHWDKLVISTQTFPEMYWDKFVKKKVKAKYGEQFDLDQLCKLLGINAKSDEYKADEGKGKAEKITVSPGFFAKFRAIDWNYQIWKAGVIFSDNSFIYVFWYFCFSVLGNFNFFFFSCHLVDVAVSIKSLTTILKSITHNGKQLLLTMMLMAIVVYMYTVIAFNFFRKFYAPEEDGEVTQNCHDLFTCFKFHLYMGIRSGGGIGDVLEPPDGDDREFYRIIFDITFFFFIIVILLAIIQGLIIDAFGELRDQLNAVSETLEAACFICGISKDYFDKVPHGFEIHTMKEHNFANYMFFLMHIINKPDTEHTGQETYVWQMYNQRCWDFFPAGDCFRKQYEGELEQK